MCVEKSLAVVCVCVCVCMYVYMLYEILTCFCVSGFPGTCMVEIHSLLFACLPIHYLSAYDNSTPLNGDIVCTSLRSINAIGL